MNLKLIIFLFFYSFNAFTQVRILDSLNIQEIKIDNSSIRAIYVRKDSSVYYASSNGTVGLVDSSGKILHEQKIINDENSPEIRAIASSAANIYVLSAGNPALLYRYTGNSLKLLYREEGQNVFYDAMTFFDELNGIAMGDPTGKCLSIIMTDNGGKTWKKLPCSNLPKIKEGEAAFAASNGNIAIVGSSAWLVTGGKHARVFYTPDKGKSWKVYDTPIVQGGQMTGIYSVDFYDSKNGIIFGGDWNKKANNHANKAITNDGGKTWHLIADGSGPGYKSCVRYVPNTNGKEVFAVGATGISYSNDGGYTWKKVSDQGFYTIRFVNKNIAWLAGNNKIAKLTLK